MRSGLSATRTAASAHQSPHPSPVRPQLAHAGSEAYDFRLTPNGINVWSSNEDRLIEWQWDAFVPRLIRAVRNSAHGLMVTFEGNDRDLAVAHSGEMAPELPELAALLVLALVAGADRLCAGTWLA